MTEPANPSVLRRILSLFGLMPVRDHERYVRKALRTAADLKAATYRMWELFERSPVGIAFVDKYGRARRVNAALCVMLGYSEQELQSMTYHEITHADDVPLSRDLFNALINGTGRRTYTLKKRYLYNPKRLSSLLQGESGELDGVVHVRITMRRLDDADDGIVVMSMIEDVTEMHHRQRELEERNFDLERKNYELERLRERVEAIAFGVVSGDRRAAIEAALPHEAGYETDTPIAIGAGVSDG